MRGRVILASLAAAALGVAVYLSLHEPGPESDGRVMPEPAGFVSSPPVAPPAPQAAPSQTPAQTPPAQTPAQPSAPARGSSQPAPAAESPLTPGSLAEIRRCLGDDGVRSLDQLLARLTPHPSPGQSSTRYRKYRNVHVRLPSGEKRRLQLFSDSTPDGKPVMRLRVFGEDAEGLPVPISIPESHSSNPDESLIQSYLAGGTPEFTEESLSWQGSTGTVEWTEENGRVRELHWVGGGRSLGCARPDIADCECRE